MNYDIWTDGGCRGNGKEINSGGWGVVVTVPTQEEDVYIIDIMSGVEENTTNNRMELTALLNALEYAWNRHKLDSKSCYIIHSDSAYCVNIFNNWIHGWASNNWVRSGDKPIENLDLIKKIYEYVKKEFPPYEVRKTSGHSGIIGNEIADAAATNNQIKLADFLEKCKVPYL